MQPPIFFCAEPTRGSLWVETGSEQCFIDINVAKPRHAPLIQQRALEFRGSSGEDFFQSLRAEPFVQRLGSKAPLDRRVPIREQVDDAAKFSLIRKTKLKAVRKLECQMLETQGRVAGSGDLQLSGHPKMYQEMRVVAQFEEQVFPSPGNTTDIPSDNTRSRCIHAGSADDPVEITYPETGDRAAHSLR